MNVVPLHGQTGKTGVGGAQKNGIVAALDIGSSKICCLIARIEPVKKHRGGGQNARVLGVGHHASQGIRAGAVVDIDAAERAVRLAVDAAERMAQVSISQVFVNISGGRPVSLSYSASCEVRGEMVEQHDVAGAVASAVRNVDAGGRVLLHASPVQYHLDDARGIFDPRGMYGKQLSVDLNAVLVEPGAMRNLALVIERCHLGVAGFVLAPYAAGRAVLSEDERQLGVTLVEMGGATTSIAVFHEGKLVHGEVLAVGGDHITRDLGRGLTTTIAHAERIKTLYGSALPSLYDDREYISVPLLGERGVDKINKVPRSMLTGIIHPRIEETLEMVNARLKASPVAARLSRNVVLSGGASQLGGLREVAEATLGRTIRIAKPVVAPGLPESARSPAFAVASGLIAYAMEPDRHTARLVEFDHKINGQGGYFSRVGRWIRESF